MMQKKTSLKSPASTSDQLRLKQVEKLQLAIDQKRGELISRALVKDEWTQHITKLFDIIDKSVDRSIYISITREMKSYLHGRCAP
jgi:hypothetical protein